MAETTLTNAPDATSSKPKITLVWLKESRAERIAWLFEELGFEYEVKVFPRQANKQAPPELKEYHPLGKSPVVVIDGETIAESGYIVEYIIDKYAPQLKPAEGTPAYAQYKYLMHYTEGSLMGWLVLTLVASGIRNSPVPFFIKPITSRIANGLMNDFIGPNLETHMKYLDGLVAPTGWFAGNDLSGADFMLQYPMFAARGRVPQYYSKELTPNLFAWTEKIEARPAFQRAMERVKNVESNL